MIFVMQIAMQIIMGINICENCDIFDNFFSK